MKKIKIICTLGPSTLKKKILKELIKKDVDILRLNMSHLSLKSLDKILSKLKKEKEIFSKICIDTEGAQIRTTKIKKPFYLKKNCRVRILSSDNMSSKTTINLYPKISFKNLKKNDSVDIGFSNLTLKILKNMKSYLNAKVTNPGYLESNKGVHIKKSVNLNFLTYKDKEAIKLGLKFGIKKYALSFANYPRDVINFRYLIGKNNFLISKIETLKAVNNVKEIMRRSDAVLIDRGDLSREVMVEEIPKFQLKILKISKKIKKRVFIATNLLESMVSLPYPTRAESNDIYFSLFSGAAGLVLAAETAIGKYPVQCVEFVRKCINSFQKNNGK